MTKNIIPLIIAALVTASCGYKSSPSAPSKKEKLPKDVKLISYTPVKNQGTSDLCWAYGMLATIESEHIMKGDSINLSTAYIARMMLHDKAFEHFFSEGKKDINLRGMGSTIIYFMQKYGAEPYDSYEDPKNINYKVLCRKLEQLSNDALMKKAGLDKFHKDMDQLLNQEIGYLPSKIVHMLGAEYTPQEFAHSICYPDEYVPLTSFTHHPFREYFALEVPDNQLHDLFLNVPLEEMIFHIQKAIERGHPVCWEGDISEIGFNNKTNYVDIQPSERPVTQESRQREFELLHTTDDHTMEIVGMFRHGKQNYYVCKNSWGKEWGNNGLIYLSEDYIRLKTIAVYMSEKAFIPYEGKNA